MNNEHRFFDLIGFIRRGLASFERDPASTDYQRGFRAALETINDYVQQGQPREQVIEGVWHVLDEQVVGG